MIPDHDHLQIGALLFEGIDQIDVTGPFEVLSRLPNSTYRLYATTLSPVRDVQRFRLMADALLSDAPQLDVLHVPGGPGQEALMENEEVLGWLRQQAVGARCVFSVCTGALICGAAGLIRGRRATTHWSTHHLLPYFGATPINERVVVDGNWVFAAGVTAGIDGALRVAAELRGEKIAQMIQLGMEYAPEPPFSAARLRRLPRMFWPMRGKLVRQWRREGSRRHVGYLLGWALTRRHKVKDHSKGNFMNASHTLPSRQDRELGELLRYWRSARGKSQLDLSLDSGLSQRHLSFIESGRSTPSRQALLDIAQALDIPLRERNTLALSAGYAPVYAASEWSAPEMQSLTKALERVLRQHEPYPAVVMDRYWQVLMRNDSAPRFFNRFIDLDARPQPRNLLHMMFDPKGLRPFIANWPEVAASLLQRVYRESIGRVIDEKTCELLAELQAYPGVKAEWTKPSPSSALPLIPIGFALKGKRINLFSLITTVGAPVSITAQEFRMECMFPADDESERNYLGLMAKKPKRKRMSARS
jgi:putative intracellular protease/amidase/transcriptional regulator with XRE-family HTH domain